MRDTSVHDTCGSCGQDRSTHDDGGCPRTRHLLQGNYPVADERMDCVTSGVQALIHKGNRGVCWFVGFAPGLIRGKEPSMVVGRPGDTNPTHTEDGGNTIVVPLPPECPKLYACQNETGGSTVMLAEEY